MERFNRIAYGLTGLLLVHLLNPIAAWLLLAGCFVHMIAGRRQQALRSATLL